MPSWIELVSMVTSLVAIWYTYREAHRNNNVVLRILECSSSGCQSVTENGGQYFHTFKLLIQNLGIALHHPHVIIAFSGPSVGGGTCLFPLKRRALSGDDEFAKGMIAEFGLKSYELDAGDLVMLSNLQDSSAQGARFNVYSQNYLASSFRVGGLADWLKQKWNWLSHRVNLPFRRKLGVSSEGHNVIREYKVMPRFTTLDWPVQSFCRAVEKQLRQPT